METAAMSAAVGSKGISAICRTDLGAGHAEDAAFGAGADARRAEVF